tara:strand:- start:115 stop:414 length:300 start_codon:yes stop_codon:yes gene_type:complete
VNEQEISHKVRMIPLLLGMLSLFIAICGLLAFEIWALFLREGDRIGFESAELILIVLFISGGRMLRYAVVELTVQKPNAVARWSSRLFLTSFVLTAWFS